MPPRIPGSLLLGSLQLWRGVTDFPQLLLSLDVLPKEAPKSKCFSPLLELGWSRNFSFLPVPQESCQDLRNNSVIPQKMFKLSTFGHLALGNGRMRQLQLWIRIPCASKDLSINSYCPRWQQSPLKPVLVWIRSCNQCWSSRWSQLLVVVFLRIFLCLSFDSAKQKQEEKRKVTKSGLVKQTLVHMMEIKVRNSLKPRPQELSNGSLL